MVKRFATEVPAAFHNCDVHVLGDSEGDFLTCSDVFMAHAGDVFFDECFERGLGAIRPDRRVQVVILHMGDCVTQHWVIDLLKDFRRRNPSAVVIVGSRDVANDDLTCEWVELCDVFMRVPKSPIDMIAAYRAASLH
ncbi:hypothetical protein [Solirhodobacter olei]|uniref:hypothetical protein n=1 Tax=Solirhodobacter olei TaxID=2493082 RepID=UPI000FDAD459|nr:hypothetical protein [Solirhodobacter olei]